MTRLASALLFLLSCGAVGAVGAAQPRFFSDILTLIVVLSLGHMTVQRAGRVATAFKLAYRGAQPPSASRHLWTTDGYLLRIANLFFPERTCLVFEPVVSDLHEEYLEASANHQRTGKILDLYQARCVVLRGYWAFLAAFLTQLGFSFLAWLVKLAKAG